MRRNQEHKQQINQAQAQTKQIEEVNKSNISKAKKKKQINFRYKQSKQRENRKIQT